MTKKPKAVNSWANSATNILGALGYISVLFQWAWTLLILSYPLLLADHSILLPNQPRHPTQPATGAIISSPIVVVVSIVVTLFILVLTAIVLVRLPRTIGRRGAHLTHTTASIVVPLVTKRISLPKKKQRQLSYGIIIAIKALLVAIPLAGLLYIPVIIPLSAFVVWILGVYCASWSIAYFTLQQLVGKIFKVPLDKLW